MDKNCVRKYTWYLSSRVPSGPWHRQCPYKIFLSGVIFQIGKKTAFIVHTFLEVFLVLLGVVNCVKFGIWKSWPEITNIRYVRKCKRLPCSLQPRKRWNFLDWWNFCKSSSIKMINFAVNKKPKKCILKGTFKTGKTSADAHWSKW